MASLDASLMYLPSGKDDDHKSPEQNRAHLSSQHGNPENHVPSYESLFMSPCKSQETADFIMSIFEGDGGQDNPHRAALPRVHGLACARPVMSYPDGVGLVPPAHGAPAKNTPPRRAQGQGTLDLLSGDTPVRHPSGQPELSTPWKQIASLIYPPHRNPIDQSPASTTLNVNTPPHTKVEECRPVHFGVSPFSPDVVLGDTDVILADPRGQGVRSLQADLTAIGDCGRAVQTKSMFPTRKRMRQPLMDVENNQSKHRRHSAGAPVVTVKAEALHVATPDARSHDLHVGDKTWQGSASADMVDSPKSNIRGTSSYRGVSQHRLTRRWEASLWINRKQVYLGGFDTEIKAARAYDVAALICKGPGTPTNFPEGSYTEEVNKLKDLDQEALVAHLRRHSSAFSRGRSKYRGVSGHCSRWEARIGNYFGRKNVSFGVYEEESEAAKQYDRALIISKGREAKTNYPWENYVEEVDEYERSMKGSPEMLDREAIEAGGVRKAKTTPEFAALLCQAVRTEKPCTLRTLQSLGRRFATAMEASN